MPIFRNEDDEDDTYEDEVISYGQYIDQTDYSMPMATPGGIGGDSFLMFVQELLRDQLKELFVDPDNLPDPAEGLQWNDKDTGKKSPIKKVDYIEEFDKDLSKYEKAEGDIAKALYALTKTNYLVEYNQDTNIFEYMEFLDPVV